MTDRETLQSVENNLEALLDIVRAQLATNVIPVLNNPPVVEQPVNPIVRTGNPFLDAYGQSNPGGSTTTVTTPSTGAGYEGHDLTKGHPRINVEYAGSAGAYRFTGPGVVYYQVVAGTDSGMRVVSWITKADGTPVFGKTVPTVISNKQSFTVAGNGDFIFYVQPEQTGPISVGLE